MTDTDAAEKEPVSLLSKGSSLSMLQTLLSAVQQRLEQGRLCLHFKRVEAILRSQDISHLPPPLQQARRQQIDRLHTYARRGVFPRNYEQPGYAPCFIDQDGHECAVAYLVMISGHTDVAHQIAATANYAYIPEMNCPELDEWAAQVGLSKEELALIQPGYWISISGELLLMTIGAWVSGLVLASINWVQIARQQNGRTVPVIALIVALFLFLTGVFWLHQSAEASWLGMHPDVSATMRTLALRDVEPLAVSGIVSLGIAALTGGLGLYRLQNFLR